MAGVRLHWPAVGMSNQKGGSNVVDDCCGGVDFVAIGISWRLYRWWTHSYPAGRCHHRRGDPSYSGTKGIAIRIHTNRLTANL